jgi:thioredoxin 1
VDTEAETQLAGEAGITSIPTLMVFRDGVLLFNQAGAFPAPALEELIQAVRDLNMDEIRQEIESQGGDFGDVSEPQA